MLNDIENNDIRQSARKQERGRAFIVFGSICALLSIALSVLAPFVVSSTIDANKSTKGVGAIRSGGLMYGLAIEIARGIAQAMVMAGIFFGIVGLIMIATGVVREYRRRKTYR